MDMESADHTAPSDAGAVAGHTAASPGPASAKDVRKALEAEFKNFASGVTHARKTLAHAEALHAAAVRNAEQAVARAQAPRKIAAVGLLSRVTLTETTLKTPKGEFPLNADVTASAEQHGNKQVVQGWIFKSDNDRREVYLHLNGSDWSVVVPFAMKNSLSDPRQLHEFAAQVNQAARRAHETRAAIAARVSDATEQLRRARADRADILAAVREVQAAIQPSDAFLVAQRQAEQYVADAEPGDREVQKLTKKLADVRQRVTEWQSAAPPAIEAVANQVGAHDRPKVVAAAGDVPTPTEPAADLQQPTPVAMVPHSVRSGNESDSDIFETIRKLGELQQAGLLTPEEFAAKKAELLARL